MSKTKQIARTAVLIALLVAVQYVTKGFGQFVTGSCVNLILAVSVLSCGLWSGAAIALISPFCAFLLGIGPAFIQLVPAVAAGNVIYVVLLSLLYGRIKGGVGPYVSVVIAALAKFALLYSLIVKLLLPMLGLPEQKVAVMSATFSWPQLVTALIGGVLCVLVYPVVKKAFQK